VIAFMTGKKQLKGVAALFSYFQKVKEPAVSEDELSKLVKPQVDFEQWLGMNRQMK
jgi:hypothetical protein